MKPSEAKRQAPNPKASAGQKTASNPKAIELLRLSLTCRRTRDACVVAYALFTASIFLAYGFSVRALSLCALGLVLLAATLTDLAERIIPNELIAAGTVAWVAQLPFLTTAPSAIEPGASALEAAALAAALTPTLSTLAREAANGLAGGIGTAALLLALSLVLDAITGKRNLGGGDVKLFFLTGLYLGAAANLLNVFLACLFALAITHATPSAARTFPFAPALAVATWCALLLRTAC